MSNVTIVTGASRGIGAAIARRLAADGHAVAVNYSTDPAPADEVVAEIIAAGGRAVALRADVADPEAVERLFDKTAAALGPVTALVANAGIMKLSTIAEADDETFDRHVSVNLKGVFNGLRTAANRLPDGGRIVSLSTSVVGMNLPRYGIYAATKAAVETLTRILAKELGPRGITVNAIAPGATATDLFFDGKDEAMLDRMKAMIPLGRFAEPDEIAGVVAFLLGPDGGWVNGQVLRANGGVA